MNEDVFAKLVRDVESNELVLPDFQRKFIWDREMMCKLFASVLCKMPLGSILILNSKDNDFSCKEIGAKQRDKSNPIVTKQGENISYLIDGQQRITSLFAGFTTHFLESFHDNPKNAASPELLDMYFLGIPKDIKKYPDLDIFNLSDLKFNKHSYDIGDKFFSSSIMQKLIFSEKVSSILPKGTNFDINNPEHFAELRRFCTEDKNRDFYYIPLQFLINNDEESLGLIFDLKEDIGTKYIPSDIKKSDETALRKRRQQWSDAIFNYLTSCISNIDLNKIIVPNSDKERAIDIYSNLNLGGVSLSVFDLIMAKVGSISDNNFYDTLEEYIKSDKNYPENIFRHEKLEYINPSLIKNASIEIAHVIDGNDNISKEYINVFLDVLVMYVTQKIKKTNKEFDVNCTKQSNILGLTAHEIYDNAKIICDAIDRALLFFICRCGIRQISDVNYKAMIVVIAYFFTDDKLFNNPTIHWFFEYWYWISLFAHRYSSNQNIEIYKEITPFENFFNKSDKSILDNLKKMADKNLLNFDGVTDKDTLCMKGYKQPSKKITNYVCQFYLSEGYVDFLNDSLMLNTLYLDKLDIHHVMPLTSDEKYKKEKLTGSKLNKAYREDKNNIYNSPLNMIYITQPTNKKISNMDYNDYSKNEMIQTVLPNVGCLAGLDTVTISEFLEARYTNFKSSLVFRTKKLYDCLVKY